MTGERRAAPKKSFADGLGVAVRGDQAKIVAGGVSKPGTRTLRVQVRLKEEAIEMPFVLVHGLHSAKATRQLETAASCAGDGMLGGDFNHVPCINWHCGRTALNAADKVIRAACGWRCQCCVQKGEPEHTQLSGGVGRRSRQ